MRKIVILLLSIVLIFSFVFSASAEVTYNDSLSKVDLLPSSGYQIKIEDDLESEDAFDEFSFKSSYPYFSEAISDNYGIMTPQDVNKVTFEWTPTNYTFSDSAYFYIFTDNAAVTIRVNGTIMANSVVGSSGRYGLFKINFTSRVINTISIQLRRNSNFNSAPVILSAFTYPVFTGLLDSGDIAADFYMSDYDDDRGIWVNFIERKLDAPMSLQDDKSYPYYSPKLAYENYWITKFHKVDQVRLHLIFDMASECPTNFINQFRLSFASIGSTQISTVFASSSYSEFSNDGVILDDELWYGDFAAAGLSNSFTAYEANGYNIFIDMSGINFVSLPYLHVELVLNPFQTTGESGDSYSYFELFEAEYSYSIESDLTTTILLSDLSDLINKLSLFYGDFESFMESQQCSWLDLRYSLEDIKDLLASSDSQKDQAAADKSTMQSQSAEVDSLNQTMDSVTRENVDIGGLITNSVTFSPTALSFMSLMTNNSYVYLILLLVFTLALVGYVLFGKR